MKNYRELDGCFLCKHAIVDADWEGVSIYCIFDKTHSNESYKLLSHNSVLSPDDWEFEKWKGSHEVRRNGICDSFDK